MTKICYDKRKLLNDNDEIIEHPNTEDFMELFGFCGCGNPDEFVMSVYQFLKLTKDNFEKSSSIYESTPRDSEEREAQLRRIRESREVFCGNSMSEYLYLYWLDSQDYLEHGSGIGSSWLSDEGEVLLELLEQNKQYICLERPWHKPKPVIEHKIIAIDYDGTYTADPELWDMFIKQCVAKGHTVICVTMRYKHESENMMDTIGKLVSQIIFTGRKAKEPFLKQLNITPHIWVDDNPNWIYTDSR